ncbi:hypothetical protein LTR24_008778 [Lithohypha guttulata]|uniref:Glycosyl transferase CAP10 domain-containing protein n=1 Tax=Lithohypha guttulata TaxID=1690604 RepID=A0ABR0JZ64_9EURO|nr:hypothetical protein LTR24_008778 [Lithohypha guttulata]
MPMLALLTLLLVVMPPNLETSSMEVIGQAMAQAAWWFAIVTVIRFQLTNTSVNLDTIGFSIQLAGAGCDMSSFAQALSVMLLSIGQTFITVRPGTAIRRVIYMLVALFVLGLWIREAPGFTTTASNNTKPFSGHPVEYLVTHSRAKLDDMLSRQSKNVDEAVAEYQRRYGRQPPLGFDQWFNLAVQNDFVLIDEFDTLMAGLEPFHGVHPFILEQRMKQVIKSDAGQLFVMQLADGNVTMSGKLHSGDKLVDETWLEIVPYNMTVALNTYDEPMVNTRWDEIEQAIDRAKHHERYPQNHEIKETNITPLLNTGTQNGWAATGRGCPLNSPSRQFACVQRQIATPIPFISNVTASKDVCQNCELLQEEGLLLLPWNMKVAHDLVPIWSASRLSHFHDILYPSAHYIAVRGDYSPEKDMPWDDKDNKFYWAGGDTGGWATGQTWNHMQRQRLVLKTKQTNKDPIQLLEEIVPGSNRWSPRFSTMAEIVDLFATQIAYVLQCTDEACLIKKAAFGLGSDTELVSQDDSYSHKFVMDIDGNGFSGRFYRLLHSRSVVVKQTIMKEWHDDRLMPWVHYVPVSTGYSELPELARFLATTDKGLELSERIARESTEWHDKALRDVDLRLVFLRMLLEYGRIMNPDMT